MHRITQGSGRRLGSVQCLGSDMQHPQQASLMPHAVAQLASHRASIAAASCTSSHPGTVPTRLRHTSLEKRSRLWFPAVWQVAGQNACDNHRLSTASRSLVVIPLRDMQNQLYAYNIVACVAAKLRSSSEAVLDAQAMGSRTPCVLAVCTREQHAYQLC